METPTNSNSFYDLNGAISVPLDTVVLYQIDD